MLRPTGAYQWMLPVAVLVPVVSLGITTRNDPSARIPPKQLPRPVRRLFAVVLMNPKPNAGPVAGVVAPQVRTLTKNVVSGSDDTMKEKNHCRSSGGLAGSTPATLRVNVRRSRRSAHHGSAIE